MLPAKFFAALATVFSICVAFAWLNPSPTLALNTYIRGTYVVFGPVLVLLFCAAASFNFAVLYYAAVRFFRARWNRTLSVLHICFFACSAISFSVVFAMSARLANGLDRAESLRWLVIPWLIGILSLVICFVMFGVNLVLTVVQLVRARSASQ
jgi:hypothetical protein